MKLTVTSYFARPVEEIWAEVQKSQLMLTVIKPLVQFLPIEPEVLPAIWAKGDYLGDLRLFGLIPYGQHTIRISFPTPSEAGEYRLRDNGGGEMVPRWDHLITIRRVAATHTLYKDEVEVEAGLLTILVWLFAHGYYRYRQWRWQRLIRANFDYSQLR